MKKLFAILLCGLTLAQAAHSQNLYKKEIGYHFKELKSIPCTYVKNQDYSSTCWSFAGLSFLESEMMRAGRDSVSLSPMWIVRCAYIEKAIKFVRMHGSGSFTPGGATCDVFDVIRKYGMVPLEVYKGLNYGSPVHKHSELHSALRGYIAAIARDPNKGLSTAWLKGFTGILDAYLGAAPETFTFRGKEYTPQSFAESTGLNMDDYIHLTSFTHHPFYTQFAIEVEDNWNWGNSYNLPLDELVSVFDNAIENGYTIYWCADVSESTFASTRGFASLPSITIDNVDEADRERWLAMNPSEKRMYILNKIRAGKEIEVSQEARQVAFDNFQTTDDHGLHIMGRALDQNGTKYYKVKNSWGEAGQDYKGFFYASDTYVAMKTINMVVNRNSIPRDIRKKLGLK